LATWRSDFSKLERYRFFAEKAILPKTEKGRFFLFARATFTIAFLGRQDARNCVKVVLTPCKGVSFSIRKIVFSAEKEVFFHVLKNRFFRLPSRSKLCQGCSVALKKRPLSGSEKTPFLLKKRILSGSEKLLFQVAMSLEIAWRLFWRPEKASLFRFGKFAFWAEKAISFKFGKIAFSGRQDARNCVRVILAPWKCVPFQVQKITFSAEEDISFRLGKICFSGLQDAWNCVWVVLATWKPCSFRFGKIAFSLKKWYLSCSDKSLFLVGKMLEIVSKLFWLPKKSPLSGSEKSPFLLQKRFLWGSEKSLF